MLLHLLRMFSITIIGLSAAELNLPVTTCKRNSEDYSICLKRATNEAWPRFVAGLPEFDFPVLDPLVIKNERIVFNSSEIHGVLTVSNYTVLYLSTNRFIDVRTHYIDDTFRLQVYGQLPKCIIKASVKLDGILSVFRIVSEGYINITLEDVRTTIDLTGHVINNTWIIEHSQTALSFATFKLYFDSLLGDNQEFYNIIVSFVNEFWPAIFRQAWPFLRSTADSWIIGFATKLFSKVPFSNVFP